MSQGREGRVNVLRWDLGISDDSYASVSASAAAQQEQMCRNI